MDKRRLLKIAKGAGAANTAVIEVKDVPFEAELRKACEQNTCRRFGASHTCPPACGGARECIDRVRAYKFGLIMQTVHRLEDSFDFEGMTAAKDIHDKTFRAALNAVKAAYPRENLLPLSAGACTICEKCAYPKPCPHPVDALSSIEAHCIYVNKMLDRVGLKYNNGEATVSYVGVIFF